METESDDKYPIALLIDELKNEDVNFRLNSIKRLNSIALALGPDRTRNELIPFLKESCIEDEDEILLELANQLNNFVDFVGGSEKSYCLIGPLENLCGVEDPVVREKAIEALNNIASQMKKNLIEQYYLPLLKRLSSANFFTSRSSSCGLFNKIYNCVSDEEKNKMIDLYENLCKDETPMVRRSASFYLGTFAEVVGKDNLNKRLLGMFLKLSCDQQDSVRLLTIQNCISFSKLLEGKEKSKSILPVVKNCGNDQSWRIRYNVAEKFKEICESMGVEITKKELMNSFLQLCGDSEPEVRTASAYRIADVCSLIPKEQIISDVMGSIKKLSEDKNELVRAALGNVIMSLSPILGKEDTIKHLLPCFLQFLKDEASEVRLNIISKLEDVNKVIGIDKLSTELLPTIIDLAEDQQWRVRLEIIKFIPLLSTQLGIKFFDDKLSNLCITWLSDSVYSIREAAIENLKKLTQIFGVDWSKNSLLPKIFLVKDNSNYLYRMTTLFAISALCEVMPSEIIVEKMIGIVLQMANDPVPNIKFNVAKTLQVIIKKVEPKVFTDIIKPCLLNLQLDEDPDVRYFAALALQTN